MTITKKEGRIIEILSRWRKAGRKTFTIEELCEAYYKANEKPECFRSSMSATLRNFSHKAQASGLRLRRTSGIGRGAVGTYVFDGDFTRLLRRTF